MSYNRKASENLFRLCETNPVLNRGTKKIKDLLSQFIVDGADPNFHYKGNTCLCEASRRGDLVIVELLLRHGASVDNSDENGATPLYLAASHERLGMVNLLLSHGANPNTENSQEISPLSAALLKSTQSIISVLIENGANVNIVHLSEPLLQFALTKKKNLLFARRVLDAGASPFYQAGILFSKRVSIYLDSYEITSWISSLKCLKSAGFDINVHIIPRPRHKRSNRQTYLVAHSLAPEKNERRRTLLNLEQLCRIRIRHELVFSKTRGHIRQKIGALYLPERIKIFLKFDDELVRNVQGRYMGHWTDYNGWRT